MAKFALTLRILPVSKVRFLSQIPISRIHEGVFFPLMNKHITMNVWIWMLCRRRIPGEIWRTLPNPLRREGPIRHPPYYT